MQLHLALEGPPSGNDSVWEQLDEATRQGLIEALALVIAKVVVEQGTSAKGSGHE